MLVAEAPRKNMEMMFGENMYSHFVKCAIFDKLW